MPEFNRSPSDASNAPQDLGQIHVVRKTGEERFMRDGRDAGFDVLGFWQWSASDLISNATRGVLAEYIVAQALGIAGEGIRSEWAPHDLTTLDGICIEVKSAAYVQSWYQTRLSTISYGVRKTLKWDSETNRQGSERVRTAHVYVFALFTAREKRTANPMDLDQWEFYVVPTSQLDERARSHHSITLPSLRREFGPACDYANLATRVREAVKS